MPPSLERPTLQIFPTALASGAWNMARDEAMLLRAVEVDQPCLRFYSWAEPTLTLGYFQQHTERRSHPRLGELAWVRRATGGGAIVHDPACEITYALALPANLGTAPTAANWICQMHYLIRDALAELGASVRAVVCGEEQKLDPFLCFSHHTPGDLACSGVKVAGSAQRKQRGAILQHGSLTLRGSPLTPMLPGLAELTGISVHLGPLADALQRQITHQLGWHIRDATWTDAMDQSAQQIHAGTYATVAWNEKR